MRFVDSRVPGYEPGFPTIGIPPDGVRHVFHRAEDIFNGYILRSWGEYDMTDGKMEISG